MQVDLPHAGALGEMSVGLRNYWDVWLTIADAGVPWAAVGGCLRLGQPSWAGLWLWLQANINVEPSRAFPWYCSLLLLLLLLLLLRVIVATLLSAVQCMHATPEARALWISMTMFSGGWNIPRAHVIAEGSPRVVCASALSCNYCSQSRPAQYLSWQFPTMRIACTGIGPSPYCARTAWQGQACNST